MKNRQNVISISINAYMMTITCNFIYIYFIVNYMFKPLISRYRLHAHSLNIETGRNYIQLFTFNEIYS